MTRPTFGYVRIPLVAPTRMAALEARLAEVAALYGGDLDERMFYERGCPAPVLWSLVNESGPATAERVAQLARQRGIDMGLLLDTAPPTTALWQLMGALETAGGGYVLIPSPAHLGGVGVPKETVLQRISDIDGSTVIWLDDELPSGPAPNDGATGVIAEFRVSALGAATAIARATVDQRLGRAGLRHMVDAVDAVMVEVVGAAERRWAAGVDTLTEALTVRVLCPPGAAVLVVEVHESPDSSDVPLSAALRQIGKVTRFRAATGGTVTRCDLAQAAAEPSQGDTDAQTGSTLALADALTRFHRAASETRSQER